MAWRKLFLSFLPLLLAAILLHPLLFLIAETVWVLPEKGFREAIAVLRNPVFLSALRFTLWQAILSVAGSLLLGFLGAWILAKHAFRGKNLLYSLFTLPMMFPVILAVLCFIVLYGEEGVLNNLLLQFFSYLHLTPLKIHVLYSLPGIVLAHVFFNAPLVAKIVGRAWEHLGEREEEAALTLGASRQQIFRTVTLPKLLPSILSAGSIAFVFCFTSFAIPLVLGANPTLSTIEVLIFEQARILLDFPRAIILALIEFLLAGFFFLLAAFAYLRMEVMPTPSPLKTFSWRESSLLRKGSLLLFGFGLGSFLFFPFLALIGNALGDLLSQKGRLLLSPFFWERCLQAGRNSFFIASLSAILATTVGASAAYSVSRLGKRGKWFDALSLLPATMSGIVIGMGYLKTYGSSVAGGSLSGIFAMALLHSAMNYPFAYKIMAPACTRVDQRLLEAGSLLGANFLFRLQSLVFPVLRPALVVSLGITFALSLGEFTATAMLYTEELKTIPILIYELISSYRLAAATILGTLFLGAAVVLLFALERHAESKGVN